jgi:hypothetical protein
MISVSGSPRFSRLEWACGLVLVSLLVGCGSDGEITLIDANTPASVKVRAAEAIFNHAAKAIEIEDIEARVAALEEAAGKKGPRG